MLAAQSCLTLCDPMSSVTHQSPRSIGFSSKNTRVGSHSLLQGHLPNSGIESRSPALLLDSLPSEPRGKTPEPIEHG